jgi:hypothetical protein
MPASEQLVLLLVAPISALIPLIVLQGILELLRYLGVNWSKQLRVEEGELLPAAFLGGGALLILFDNFTYTLFGFGSLLSTDIVRIIYAALFLWLTRLSYQFFRKIERGTTQERRRIFNRVAAGLCLASVGASLYTLFFQPIELPISGTPSRRPNILILASDGISATHMSAYGYKRDTTPFLKDFSKESLVFENAFTNSATTYSSLTSTLTGKLPYTTKVVYPPDTLTGSAVFEHLPGVLKAIGYRGFQSTLRYYADSRDAGLVMAFDQANGRNTSPPGLEWLIKSTSGSFLSEFFFASRVFERLEERLLHIFFIRPSEHNFEVIKSRLDAVRSSATHGDRQRVDDALNFISALSSGGAKKSTTPWFVHIHMMESHCCDFFPRQKFFSKDSSVITTQNEDDFYDDTIRYADQLFGYMIGTLDRRGLLDDTIVVITSDHGGHWTFDNRVPLMIRFPKKEHVGSVKENVQLLDIAPTLMDYVGVGKPKWMEGESVLPPKTPDPKRHIYGVVDIENLQEGEMVVLAKTGAPYYGVDIAGMIACNHWYKVDLETAQVTTGTVAGHTAPCADSEVPSSEAALGDFTRFLVNHGFRLGK